MQKTDFEMIFDDKQSLAQKKKHKDNSLNEIKKIEKETETGSIDLEDDTSKKHSKKTQ